jgi:hypothetical protein
VPRDPEPPRPRRPFRPAPPLPGRWCCPGAVARRIAPTRHALSGGPPAGGRAKFSWTAAGADRRRIASRPGTWPRFAVDPDTELRVIPGEAAWIELQGPNILRGTPADSASPPTNGLIRKPSIHGKRGCRVALDPGTAWTGLEASLLDVANLFAPDPVLAKPSHGTDLSKPANSSAARAPKSHRSGATRKRRPYSIQARYITIGRPIREHHMIHPRAIHKPVLANITPTT